MTFPKIYQQHQHEKDKDRYNKRINDIEESLNPLVFKGEKAPECAKLNR